MLPSDPVDSLPYIFAPRLSVAYVNKLQSARASKVVMDPSSTAELSWSDIVAIAKDD
jgi:hypothetical protein